MEIVFIFLNLPVHTHFCVCTQKALQHCLPASTVRIK